MRLFLLSLLSSSLWTWGTLLNDTQVSSADLHELRLIGSGSISSEELKKGKTVNAFDLQNHIRLNSWAIFNDPYISTYIQLRRVFCRNSGTIVPVVCNTHISLSTK